MPTNISAKKLRPLSLAIVLASLAVLPTTRCHAEVLTNNNSGFFSNVGDYFSTWFDRVDKTLDEQPHWASPVVTTTPRLQEVLRYDIMYQSLKGGHDLVNYGSGKGLEFIPSEHTEFIIGIPPYETENTSPRKRGFGDEQFLMKYRFAAANEENGNYILTGFMGVTVPNGSSDFSARHYVYSPTLSGGKGWGDFDIFGSVGANLPDNLGVRQGAGVSILANCVLQYRVAKVFWPEVEFNYTYWPNGVHEGLNQLCITPGIVFGRFQVYDRLACMFGAGCQVTVTKNPIFYRNVIATARFPF